MRDQSQYEKSLYAELPHSLDGKVWADEFLRIFGGRRADIDADLMLCWFSNAIMAGFDEATRRLTNAASGQLSGSTNSSQISSSSGGNVAEKSIGSFDEHLGEELKDPEFREAFVKESARLMAKEAHADSATSRIEARDDEIRRLNLCISGIVSWEIEVSTLLHEYMSEDVCGPSSDYWRKRFERVMNGRPESIARPLTGGARGRE